MSSNFGPKPENASPKTLQKPKYIDSKGNGFEIIQPVKQLQCKMHVECMYLNKYCSVFNKMILCQISNPHPVAWMQEEFSKILLVKCNQ